VFTCGFITFLTLPKNIACNFNNVNLRATFSRLSYTGKCQGKIDELQKCGILKEKGEDGLTKTEFFCYNLMRSDSP